MQFSSYDTQGYYDEMFEQDGRPRPHARLLPDIIRYYEGAEPILPNVPTYFCWRDSDRSYVLEHLDLLVVESANESGRYGMLVGPHSTREQREEFAAKIQANPRNYIAQPTLGLSRGPPLWATISKAGTWISGRTFSAEGRSTWRPVNLYAQQVRRVAEEDGAALHRAELKFNAYSLIGGQMSGDSGR